MTDEFDIRKLIKLVVAGEPAAVEMIDDLIVRLRMVQDRLRENPTGCFQSAGGIGERIIMKVHGPDGELKQTYDSQGEYDNG